MSSEAKNLEAIAKAVEQHNKNCSADLVKILMNPFEVERLGWDDFMGIPIEADPEIGTGRFRLICALDELKEKEDKEYREIVREAPVEEEQEQRKVQYV